MEFHGFLFTQAVQAYVIRNPYFPFFTPFLCDIPKGQFSSKDVTSCQITMMYGGADQTCQNETKHISVEMLATKKKFIVCDLAMRMSCSSLLIFTAGFYHTVRPTRKLVYSALVSVILRLKQRQVKI